MNSALKISAMTTTTFDRKALLQTILDQFRLDRDGDHGPAHWARVRKHAMTIGRARGADLLVVGRSVFKSEFPIKVATSLLEQLS
jgi:HD superfamily phosphodiesterase